MKAEVVQMTALMAEQLLEANSNNRDVSQKKLEEYSQAMRNDDWLENGESIIVDVNDDLKDGQHRLMAMLRAGKFYKTVLVRDVDAGVMQTIDIGKNRSLADVLKLEKVKNAALIAGMITKLYRYDKNQMKNKEVITNSQGLSYFQKRARPLGTLATTVERIHKRQRPKTNSKNDLALYHYAINGFELTPMLSDFLDAICGVTVQPNKGTSYVLRKFVKAREDKIRYGDKFKLGMVIKAWNLYVEGDPDITFFKYDDDGPLPEVAKPKEI